MSTYLLATSSRLIGLGGTSIIFGSRRRDSSAVQIRFSYIVRPHDVVVTMVSSNLRPSKLLLLLPRLPKVEIDALVAGNEADHLRAGGGQGIHYREAVLEWNDHA